LVSPVRTATEFTVRSGDTLSQIAQSQLGHASYAACIVRSNPSIRDANLIYAGQVLVLPARCNL
jgi:nucleoid-associated protein YgaU